MSHIQTFTGRYVNPLDLYSWDVDIRDIAHSLSNQCRFTGHVQRFYSTAEHCVHVAELCPFPELKLAALLHDGGETYMSDIARPVKHHPSMALYRSVEKENQRVVYRAFGLPPEEPPLVKIYDNVMLGIEARDLMGDTQWFSDWVTPAIRLHPLSVRRPWSPKKAEREFLAAYRSYKKELK